jgi:HlyD family secretion protein
VSLEQAQADYDKLLEGATPEQVAAAEAEIARAQGSLRATQGSVTQADIAAARAELESAKVNLAELQAGAKSTDIQSAQASVDQAQANLQSQRDALSQAKSNAELQLTQAANALRNAQDNYSQIYWENRDLARLPGDLPQERIDQEASALRAVEDSEAAMQQAELALEQARQAEITGIASGEAQLRDAEARLENLLSPADADAIAAAQAQVANAQAKLVGLTGGEIAGNVAAAEAGVASAQAQLAEINAKPSDATLAGALARVRSADVSLRQAQLALEKATLLSPISGSVAELNIKVGEVPGGGAAALVVADLSNWQIETEDLTELNVVSVREGDQVTITFDAIDDLELPGTVTRIEPLGQTRQGDIVYKIIITPNSWDERLRWNMTASVQIGA